MPHVPTLTRRRGGGPVGRSVETDLEPVEHSPSYTHRVPSHVWVVRKASLAEILFPTNDLGGVFNKYHSCSGGRGGRQKRPMRTALMTHCSPWAPRVPPLGTTTGYPRPPRVPAGGPRQLNLGPRVPMVGTRPADSRPPGTTPGYRHRPGRRPGGAGGGVRRGWVAPGPRGRKRHPGPQRSTPRISTGRGPATTGAAARMGRQGAVAFVAVGPGVPRVRPPPGPPPTPSSPGTGWWPTRGGTLGVGDPRTWGPGIDPSGPRRAPRTPRNDPSYLLWEGPYGNWGCTTGCSAAGGVRTL